MDRSIHPLSLALGLAFGLVCVFTMGQMPIPIHGGDPWPPAKKDIVNIFQPQLSTPISIPAGGAFTVYTVPSDRWLTVTVTDSQGGTHWGELDNGNLTRKGWANFPFASTYPNSPQASGGPVGWAFHPGSSVVIENGSSTNPLTVWSYALTGYLSRD